MNITRIWAGSAIVAAASIAYGCSSSSATGDTDVPRGAASAIEDGGQGPNNDLDAGPALDAMLPPDAPLPDGGAQDGALPPRGQNCLAYTKTAPSPGAREWFVDAANGDDAHDGGSGAPFKTVQKAANVAHAGDVVTIGAGTYHELVYVQNSGTAAAPIVFQAEVCGSAVFTGKAGFRPQVPGSSKIANGCANHADGQHDITISGLTFRDTQNSPVGTYSEVILPQDDWRISNVLIDGASDIAVNARGVGVIIEQSTFMHGGSHSLVGCGGNTVVRNVVNANNVTSQKAADDCGNSCSVKFLFTDHMMVDNIESYGNNGPGWWFDTDNFHFTVQNSYFHDNVGDGVFDEISDGPGLIQNNVFERNGADIGLGESSNVTIVNNVLEGGSGSPFDFRTMTNRCEVQNGTTCSKYYWLQNLIIHDNKIKNWTGCLISNGAYSSDPAWASPLFQKLNIEMDRDTYWPAKPSSCWLSWQAEPSITSFSALQSTLVIESHGAQTDF